MQALPYRVRAAQLADIPALMRLKWRLALAEDATLVVRAAADDWLRDGFGADARFVVFVAEIGDAIVGMATCSDRYVTGWIGPTILLQDLFVDAEHRQRGVARALLAQVVLRARERGSPLVELTDARTTRRKVFICGPGLCRSRTAEPMFWRNRR